MKKKIGITGGIGTGKSLIANYYKEKGYPVINADEIAKEISSSKNQVKKNIIKEFGIDSFASNKLNTKYLAEIVFSSPENVKKLNSIIHPILKKALQKMMEYELKKSDIVFVEAALIYEAKFDHLFDYVLLVTSDIDIRINRIIQRDKSSKEKILARIKNQLSDEILRQKADFIIENDSSIENLYKKADFFLNIFKTI
ncbi:MAG: dephospho-CoA kinase [Ignavibacteriales bacterium]|nr:dephospho-CoA kinase [Ignavibacteriales bacterium]